MSRSHDRARNPRFAGTLSSAGSTSQARGISTGGSPTHSALEYTVEHVFESSLATRRRHQVSLFVHLSSMIDVRNGQAPRGIWRVVEYEREPAKPNRQFVPLGYFDQQHIHGGICSLRKKYSHRWLHAPHTRVTGSESRVRPLPPKKKSQRPRTPSPAPCVNASLHASGGKELGSEPFPRQAARVSESTSGGSP